MARVTPGEVKVIIFIVEITIRTFGKLSTYLLSTFCLQSFVPVRPLQSKVRCSAAPHIFLLILWTEITWSTQKRKSKRICQETGTSETIQWRVKKEERGPQLWRHLSFIMKTERCMKYTTAKLFLWHLGNFAQQQADPSHPPPVCSSPSCTQTLVEDTNHSMDIDLSAPLCTKVD